MLKRFILMLDASALACPKPTSTAREIEKYAKAIIEWSTFLKEIPWVKYLPREEFYALHESKIYPRESILEKIFNEKGVSEYSARDISTIIGGLYRKVGSFADEECEIFDIELDTFSADPDNLKLNDYEQLREYFAKTLATLAVLEKYCEKEVERVLVLRDKEISESSMIHNVSVKARIRSLSHECKEIPTAEKFPKVLQEKVSVCRNLEELISLFEEDKLFKFAESENEIKAIIKIAYFKNTLKNKQPVAWSDIEAPKIGHQFGKVCREICGTASWDISKKILSTIVNIISRMKECSNETSVYTDELKYQVRESDGVKVMCRSIDEVHSLYYWKCKDGTIELASVGPHNDFSIPEK